MKNTKVAQILNRLMSEQKIRVAELARRVGLAQPTVHRIAAGTCEHPHHSSLEPIAAFFSITVEQLKGLEPIPALDGTNKVPLLTWKEVLQWPAKKPKQPAFILTDAGVGPHGYAVTLMDSAMEPIFSKNTLLIADPDRIAKDRNYVIAKLSNHNEPIFRQLLIDAQDRYLKPLSPDFDQYRMTKLNQTDQILSVVVQAKRDCLGE